MICREDIIPGAAFEHLCRRDRLDTNRTVTRVEGDEVWVEQCSEPLSIPSILHLWSHKTTEQEAMAFLEKRGYTVVPPLKPRHGTNYVYETRGGSVFARTDPIRDVEALRFKVLAVVDWTEGQGLE